MNHLKLHVFKKTDRKRGRKKRNKTAVWQGLTREKTALDPSLVNRFVLLTEAISLSEMYDLSPPGPTLPPHPPPHTHTHFLSAKLIEFSSLFVEASQTT